MLKLDEQNCAQHSDKDNKDLILKELLELKREVINSGGVSLNSDISLSLIFDNFLINSDTTYYLVISDTFSRYFQLKISSFCHHQKGGDC